MPCQCLWFQTHTRVELKTIKLLMLELQSVTLLYLFQLYCHKASIVTLMWFSGDVCVVPLCIFVLNTKSSLNVVLFSLLCFPITWHNGKSPASSMEMKRSALWTSVEIHSNVISLSERNHIQMWYHWVKETVPCQYRFFKSEKDNWCFSQEFW